MTEPANAFMPDWASAPGDTIVDLIEERGWSQRELADRLGYAPKALRKLLEGQVPIAETAAHDLERVLGVPAHFWLTREAQFREQCARLTVGRTPAPND